MAMSFYDKDKYVDPENGEEYYLYKEHKNDKVWWVDYPNLIGNLAITFDKKTIIHLFGDYPERLTAEQKKLFDKENPYWADFFKDRNGPELLTGKIQKVKICSNSICFGPKPLPDDEVEQHLSIIRNGRVFFSSYVYGDGKGQYRKTVTRNFKADPAKVSNILTSFEQYFSKDYVEVHATDVGDWTMEVTNDSGDVYRFKGSLCSGMPVDEAFLSDLVRDELDMHNLYVFDGNCNEDE